MTKDERITNISLNWGERMDPDLVAEARAYLTPLRHDHPRFAYVLDRLAREYP